LMAEIAAVECDAASDSGEAMVSEGERRWWGRHVHELRWQAELVRLLVDPFSADRASCAATAVPCC
jgi:hypothetical protein